jgi:hypothetical protein
VRFVPHLLRLLAAVAIGCAVALTTATPAPSTFTAKWAECFNSLRLMRFAVHAFSEQEGMIPGHVRAADGSVTAVPAAVRAEAVRRQLCEPRDDHGRPSWAGPWRGLLQQIPLNPFTASREIVIVPAGVDAVAFAASSNGGWAYLSEDGNDSHGPLPAGLVLPCGDARASGQPGVPGGTMSVQDIGFEIEDYRLWR